MRIIVLFAFLLPIMTQGEDFPCPLDQHNHSDQDPSALSIQQNQPTQGDTQVPPTQQDMISQPDQIQEATSNQGGPQNNPDGDFQSAPSQTFQGQFNQGDGQSQSSQSSGPTLEGSQQSDQGVLQAQLNQGGQSNQDNVQNQNDGSTNQEEFKRKVEESGIQLPGSERHHSKHHHGHISKCQLAQQNSQSSPPPEFIDSSDSQTKSPICPLQHSGQDSQTLPVGVSEDVTTLGSNNPDQPDSINQNVPSDSFVDPPNQPQPLPNTQYQSNDDQALKGQVSSSQAQQNPPIPSSFPTPPTQQDPLNQLSNPLFLPPLPSAPSASGGLSGLVPSPQLNMAQPITSFPFGRKKRRAIYTKASKRRINGILEFK